MVTLWLEYAGAVGRALLLACRLDVEVELVPACGFAEESAVAGC
jgi:hypothetical protein